MMVLAAKGRDGINKLKKRGKQRQCKEKKENLKEKKPHQFIYQRKKDTTCKKNRMLLKQGWLENMKKSSWKLKIQDLK